MKLPKNGVYGCQDFDKGMRVFGKSALESLISATKRS